MVNLLMPSLIKSAVRTKKNRGTGVMKLTPPRLLATA